MKKNLRGLLGFALAIGMAISASSASFADVTDFSGSIAADDAQVNIKLPATGKLQIKPFAATQIDTVLDASTGEIPMFVNTSRDAKMKVCVAGYTATLTSADELNPISLKTTYTDMDKYGTSTKKEVSLQIQLADLGKYNALSDVHKNSEDKAMIVADISALKAKFDDAKKVDLTKASDAYTGEAESTYTKLTDTTATEITMAKDTDQGDTLSTASKVEDTCEGGVVAVRVVGTMNPNATWTTGDAIKVVPVYKLTPDVSAD